MRPDRGARRRWIGRVALGLAIVVAGACAPRARPLGGAPAPLASIPEPRLSPGSRRIVFRWEYREDDGFSARGDGVARVTAPDSARLDFFLEGGFGGGWALLLGDRLSIPGPDVVRRLIPPGPLLWAALGRLALPPAADTTARMAGDTLQVDLGANPMWRVTFTGREIGRVDRIDGGRRTEWLARDSNTVRYRHETGRRSLTLRLERSETTVAFDASIWRP